MRLDSNGGHWLVVFILLHIHSFVQNVTFNFLEGQGKDRFCVCICDVMCQCGVHCIENDLSGR
jgi:hypothetical protein